MKSRPHPPRIATLLLHAFIRRDLRDDVSADLLEQFDDQAEQRSLFRAKLNYWYQVFHYFRPFAIRRFQYRRENQLPMYRSYLTTAIRNMAKNKLHAFINISGLSIGLTVSILIALWVWDEVSYNKVFDKYDRIVQVKQHVTNNGEVQTWFNLPLPLAEELRKNYGTDFEHIAMTSTGDNELISRDQYKFRKQGLFAEPDFTRIFNLTMIEGQDNLSDPASMLISESMAIAFFGKTACIGETLSFGTSMNLKVGGVYENFPANSEFANVEYVGPWEPYTRYHQFNEMSEPWRPNMFFIYAELGANATIEGTSARIKDAKLKRVSEFLAKKKPVLFIHPINRWHLYNQFKNGQEQPGRLQYVWLFGIIAAFVLLMACINFMNLSTARSEKRAKEVGIRKAIGSVRGQLIRQFFLESMLTTVIAFIVAVIAVQLALPYFNDISEKQIKLAWMNPILWAIGAVFCLFTGIVAGSYPALYLSSIKAIHTIKGSFKASTAASVPRKVMVIVQFTVSVFLIIGTITVYNQIQYAKNRAMGYESNGLITIPNSVAIHKHFDAIRNELISNGAVLDMGETNASTTSTYASSSGFDWKGKDPDLSVDFTVDGIGYEYGRSIKWKVLSGRDFSHDFPSDSSGIIVNEAAAKYMNLTNPVGEIIKWNNEPCTIIGVIKDIVIHSPYDPIRPNIYFLERNHPRQVMTRLNTESGVNEAIAKIERAYKTYDPETIFTYSFVNQEYAKKFGNEERVGNLATIFSSLAIFISCLGIFGLSSFMAEQKTKEIGIRKVLGASISQLLALMCKEFTVLVLVSCAIAIPLAYTILSAWLTNYTYRISVPYWSFIVSTIGTLVIMLITIIWHAYGATRINPATSLRSE